MLHKKDGERFKKVIGQDKVIYGAYFCYYQGVRHLEASRAAMAATLEPGIAALVDFFWWGEAFSMAGYAGSAMILAAVLLMVLDRRGGQDLS